MTLKLQWVVPTLPDDRLRDPSQKVTRATDRGRDVILQLSSCLLGNFRYIGAPSRRSAFWSKAAAAGYVRRISLGPDPSIYPDLCVRREGTTHFLSADFHDRSGSIPFV